LRTLAIAALALVAIIFRLVFVLSLSVSSQATSAEDIRFRTLLVSLVALAFVVAAMKLIRKLNGRLLLISLACTVAAIRLISRREDQVSCSEVIYA
jgi:hypothetical protein